MKTQLFKSGLVGPGQAVKVEYGFSQHGNQAPYFSITGEVYTTYKDSDRLTLDSCGCVHEDIARLAPELAKYIKWHLCSTESPMHYHANALYHASDKDCWGKRKGEPTRWVDTVKFDKVPIQHRISNKLSKYLEEVKEKEGSYMYHFRALAVPYGPSKSGEHKYRDKATIYEIADPMPPTPRWHECPFDTLQEAEEFTEALNNCDWELGKIPTSFSEGKERDLNAARHCAIWPGATDEELMADNLKEKLEARLPALMEEFRRDMFELGLMTEKGDVIK